jgi:hypothetical protein
LIRVVNPEVRYNIKRKKRVIGERRDLPPLLLCVIAAVTRA